MSRLQNLKEEFLQKQKNVEKLNENLCQKIILRDINSLQENDVTIVSGNEKNIFFKDKLIIKVTSNGTLEIEDRRSSAFLWIFEVQHDNVICLGSTFEIDNNIYNINYINEIEVTDAMLDEIEKNINKLDESISILNSKISLDMWSYTYYCDYADIACNSLQDVLEIVLKRKY